MRDEFGLIIIDEYVPDNKKFNNQFEFDMNGKHYYFKSVNKVGDIYNGLIAMEIAKEMGIEVCPTDMASNNEAIGIISESLLDKYDSALSMDDFIKEYTLSPNKHNNLEDIWDYIDMKYKDPNITLKMMTELVRVFMFDVLIGNNDRHSDNLIIVEKDGIPSIYPLFDNDSILTDYALDDGYYSLRVSFDNEEDILSEFISCSHPLYRDMLYKYLYIIDDSNIVNILDRVEKKIGAPIIKSVRDDYINKFSINYKNILEKLEKDKVRRRINV